MNQGARQGMYIIFVIVLGMTNYFLNWFSMFEYFVICCLAMIIVKLTDIVDAIINLKLVVKK